MIGHIARAGILALVISAPAFASASAATAYDGSWSLSITTQRGACETYNFPVNITNGNVSFPGLVRANGRVSGKGAVRVNVAARRPIPDQARQSFAWRNDSNPFGGGGFFGRF
jgi:hypothetical protein